MTKRQAAVWFVVLTSVFVVVFAGLTIHSHTRFPALTHSDRITAQVRAGDDVWHERNCVNCHTLMGEGAYYAPDLTKITQLRGTAYLTQFLMDPARFYSEAENRRLMTNPRLSEAEIADVIAFLDWIAGIDNLNWPPRPILVSGSSMPGSYGSGPTGAAASDDPVALGERLFRSTPPGCFACHSTAPGVTLAGPSLAGVGARAADVVASASYQGAADSAAAYIRESILEPSAYIAAGPSTFAANGQSVMPGNFGETLTSDQVSDLVAYLLSLR